MTKKHKVEDRYYTMKEYHNLTLDKKKELNDIHVLEYHVRPVRKLNIGALFAK